MKNQMNHPPITSSLNLLKKFEGIKSGKSLAYGYVFFLFLEILIDLPVN